jgi:hypothetical protein
MTSYALTAAETTTIAGTVAENISATCEVTEVASIAPLLEAIKQIAETLAAAAGVSATVADGVEAGATASANALLTDASLANKLVLAIVADGAILTELVTPNAILAALAADSAQFDVLITINGEAFVAWVANAETYAHSRYENFNFNSMCRLGNRYYGANDEGIFLLEGENDGGDPIQYFATLPTTEFGHSGMKRVPRVYMGFSNAGDMRLKVVTPTGAEFVYRFEPSAPGYPECRAVLGKGIKCRYFTFDLYNVEGGEVDLARLEFFPLYLRRLF